MSSNVSFPNMKGNEEGFESWKGKVLKGKSLNKEVGVFLTTKLKSITLKEAYKGLYREVLEE